MTQIFEKVRPKPKPKMLTVLAQSKILIERSFQRDKNIKDQNVSESYQKNNFYQNNKYLSILTDTVLGEDYYKNIKEFSELDDFEPLPLDNLEIIIPEVSKVATGFNDKDTCDLARAEDKFQERLGCGLYMKIKREILKSLRSRIHPSQR